MQNSARVYHTAIANPRPDETIVSIDLVSLFSRATPTLFGLTAELGSGGSQLIEPKKDRILRAATRFDDLVYHTQLAVRVEDQEGHAITNAEASLILSDVDGSYAFGKARTDTNGRLYLPFAPQAAAEFTVVVRAPNRRPYIYTVSRTKTGTTEKEIRATLAPGSAVGGLVRDNTGQPLSGAAVTNNHLRQNAPKDYTRMDYDVATTDANGKWQTTALPESLDGFQFLVHHPDYRPRLCTLTAVSGSPSKMAVTTLLSVADLRASSAVVSLDPALRLIGTITDTDGKPVAGAELRLAPNRSGDSVVDEQIARSDQAGRYKFSVLTGGSYNLIVLSDRHAPALRSIGLQDGAPQTLDVAIKAGSQMTGRIRDQNQQPIAGAKVRLESWNDNRLLKFEAETDDKGVFVWTNAPEGQLRLYLYATNHSSTTYSISTSGGGEQQFQLRKLSSVRGHVVDAETGKPIPDFAVYRGRAYNPGEPIRWERYNNYRGRNGEYSLRLVEYSSNGRTAVLIEAPGYMPVASPGFTKAGIYTNDFKLKKARGVYGRVLAPDGSPAAGATVALVEPADHAYLRATGELQRNSDSLQVKTDPKGEFQLPARLDPHTIIVTHNLGYGELRITNALTPVTLKLQTWARVSGQVQFPPEEGKSHTVILHNAVYRYEDASRDSQPLSLYATVEADSNGRFQFNRVPPGDRKVSLNYSVKIGDSTRTMYSHGTTVQLSPGQSTNVNLGVGRTLVGRLKVTGADPEDVDWKRDFHTLNLSRTLNMNLPPLDFSQAKTQEQQQELWARQREAQEAFWRTPAGREYERSERSYVIHFETNATFRVEGVPPGRYNLNVQPTDSSRDDYSYEQIGQLNAEVTVPEGNAKEPVDLGSFNITVRGTLRIGRKAPRFTINGFDGKEIKLEDFRGKYVLLDFWAAWAGTRTIDIRFLKEIQQRYENDSRLVMLGINLDQIKTQAEEELKARPLTWRQAYGGSWNDSEIRTTFGLRGLPDCLLIDPDGKIAAMNLRSSNISRMVERALGEPKTASR